MTTAAKFRVGHATHPEFRMLVELAIAQLGDVSALMPPAAAASGREDDEDADRFILGIAYVTPAMEPRWAHILVELRRSLPQVQWVGSVGHSICAGNAEYLEEPALALMVTSLPSSQWAMFSGLRGAANRAALPLAEAGAILLHADPTMADVVDSIETLAKRAPQALIFGGLSSTSGNTIGSQTHVASQLVQGGLSGVMFRNTVGLRSRVTQGCRPFAKPHTVSASSAHYLQALDGEPALDVMLADLGVDESLRMSRDGQTLLRALPPSRLRSGLLIGISQRDAQAGDTDKPAPRRIGMADYQVRNVVGIDPEQRILALGTQVNRGDQVVFCTRDFEAAHGDLVRICAELRDEVEEEGLSILGAHYVSCTARGAHLFGNAGAELAVIRHNLGEVPLIGFYASGEIAGDKLYGYTGVLTLFVSGGGSVPS